MKIKAIIISVIILFILFVSAAFTVQQGQKAIILKLGKIKSDSSGQVIEYEPGLNFKIPFIETVKKYDMRLRVLSVDSSRILTAEQKDVLINAYIVWRIGDISQFYRSTSGNEARTQMLLRQYIEASLRAQVGGKTIQELINNKRIGLISKILTSIQKQAKNIGIEIDDIKIKQIDLPDTVTDSIYQRMRSDREKEASRYRAEGKESAETIRAQADAKVTVIVATAQSNAKKIKASGFSGAMNIFVNSYNQDPNFYEFMRSLEVYENSLNNKHNTLILKPEGKLFNNFNQKEL